MNLHRSLKILAVSVNVTIENLYCSSQLFSLSGYYLQLFHTYSYVLKNYPSRDSCNYIMYLVRIVNIVTQTFIYFFISSLFYRKREGCYVQNVSRKSISRGFLVELPYSIIQCNTQYTQNTLPLYKTSQVVSVASLASISVVKICPQQNIHCVFLMIK